MRVLLIGGTSNVGKSTVAQLLARRLGFSYVSTDQLGRHPGRPWPDPPAHVVEHYRSMTTDQLLDALLAHYARMQPRVEELVTQSNGLVLEGSGVWPPYVTAPAVWLTADEDLIANRIHRSSGYAALSADRRHLVDKFVARSLAYQAQLLTHDIPSVDVTRPRTPEQLAEEVLNLR